MSVKRPNYTNKVDRCCACPALLETPSDHNQKLSRAIADNTLMVWQPKESDPPQWICSSCYDRLTQDLQRG